MMRASQGPEIISIWDVYKSELAIQVEKERKKQLPEEAVFSSHVQHCPLQFDCILNFWNSCCSMTTVTTK